MYACSAIRFPPQQELNERKPDTHVHFNFSCGERICIDLHLTIDLI